MSVISSLVIKAYTSQATIHIDFVYCFVVELIVEPLTSPHLVRLLHVYLVRENSASVSLLVALAFVLVNFDKIVTLILGYIAFDLLLKDLKLCLFHGISFCIRFGLWLRGS